MSDAPTPRPDQDAALPWAAAHGHGDEVLYALDGPLGRVRLNRPQAINALDTPSIDSLDRQLRAWATDDRVEAVVLDGAGERGLCAGGDVRAIREAVLAGRPEEAVDYWRDEYAVNALVADFPCPYVAWMDGIVMGGGVGVSAHGSLRLVTPRTRIAMPETIIGFFPDVGGLWFLSHAPGELGTYAALTGATLGGPDALVLGMADLLVDAERKEEVLAALRDEPGLDARALADRLGVDLPAGPEEVPGSWLLEHRPWIDACFTGDDAAAIVRRLRERPEPEAEEAAATIEARSPHSVAITLEALRRAASLDVDGVLAQDLVLGETFARHPDFVEGVRAQLVDKDRSPRWAHPSLDAVSRDEVQRAFTR